LDRSLSHLPVLDAPNKGYEVYVVADAVGGTSVTAHEMAPAPD
jgi:nicotinamidase-related amidase